MSGDCVSNATGSVACTRTNGAAFGSPAAYAGGFAGSQNHLWLLTEGAGNATADYFGTANATSNGTFTWSADGGLTFSGGYANRAVAPNATSLLTMEVVLVSSMPLGTQTIMPMAYGGATTASSSRTQDGLILHENWQGVQGGTTAAASLPTYAGYYLAFNTFSPSVAASTTSSVQGVHVLDFEGGPGQPWPVFVDGQPVTDQFGGFSDLSPTSLNGGFVEFGGSPLGYVNCSTATCGFAGTIYGAATYSTRLTAAQIQQNVSNWMRNVLPAKGVNTGQSTYTNGGNGAQGTAGKAVNLVSFGESVTWGHGSTTPGTQSYSAVAATTINGGNANGFGFGYDSRSEYVMHKSLAALQAMYSTSATNVAVLFTNANDCRYNTSTAFTIQTYPSNVAAQAARDLIADAQTLKSQGWNVLIGTGLSGTSSFGTGDTAKDTCNPVVRQQALAAGLPLWDIANDARLGADGAYSASTGTACGGSACYQSDNLHPSQAAYAIMGANLAKRVNALLYAGPVTSTAATYSMTGTEAPLSLNPSTNSQTVTLPDCIGFTGSSFHVINLQLSGANTVTILPAATGETISGLSSIMLPNGSSVSLTAVAGADATGGCTWRGTALNTAGSFTSLQAQGDTSATPSLFNFVTSTNSGNTTGIPAGQSCMVNHTFVSAGNYVVSALCQNTVGTGVVYASVNHPLGSESYFQSWSFATSGNIVAQNQVVGNSSSGGFRGTLYTPFSSAATCTAGTFADDANFHYVCTAANTWKRVALSAF